MAERMESYKDWPSSRFDSEMERIQRELEPERKWFRSVATEPYNNDQEIVLARDSGELEVVSSRETYLPIWRLREWQLGGGYSPPLLRPSAAGLLNRIGRNWRQAQFGGALILSVTSMTRSVEYQRSLSKSKGQKIAVNPDEFPSSHNFGYAFDIDGRGMYLPLGNGEVAPVHPGTSNYSEFAEEISNGRNALVYVLNALRQVGVANYVEEVPNTNEWCFHVCANPHAE